MSGVLSYIPIINLMVGGGSKTPSIDIPPVEQHDVETNTDRRARSLKHLLKANHVNYSILYHDLEFHNHNVHVLCSAYLLGANEKQLHSVYDAEAKFLEPWKESPSEITEDDWRDYLGDGRYQRAYVDFFEDQMVMGFAYDWKAVIRKFMFEGKNPLVHGLIGGLGHPLIHLGYAYEINSKEIAMEALGMAATQYNYLHKYLDDASFTRPSAFSFNSLTGLLDKCRQDSRFDGLFKKPDFGNIEVIFKQHESLILEYWNAWNITEPVKEFEESQEAAVALLVETVAPGTHGYSFFLVHVLTTSHAVRILLPLIPKRFHIALVREWWLLTLAAYIAMLRPKIEPDYVDPRDLKGRHWTYVENRALNSPYSTDAHFVKGRPAISLRRKSSLLTQNSYSSYERSSANLG